MGKTLVLAEKPSVARDIGRVLGAKAAGEGFLSGGDWVVSWALGHLVTLCDPDEIDGAWKKWRVESLPMLPETLPTKVAGRTRAQFQVVRRLMNDRAIDRIVCATDSGREGELIFRYIYRQAGCKKPVDRLWISSMTDEAIRAGFARLQPASAYDALYESARCRSEADWLVGMNATRAFTLKYGVLLSVGRVQTPTLRILAEREREIAAFVPRDYWEATADFGDYKGVWFDPATDDAKIADREQALRIKAEASGHAGRVISVTREDKRLPPPQLYDLTTLQRDANGRLGLSAAKALEVAQSLYEKRKLITYPRTDSRYLPRDQQKPVEQALAALPRQYRPLTEPLLAGPLPAGPRIYDDAKVSDHHAIIPTGKQPPAGLSDAEKAVFDLVARRLIAVHYPDYEYQAAKAVTQAAGHCFRTAGAAVLREGWRAVYPEQLRQDAPLPNLAEGDERAVQSVAIKKLK
ncbi:MAG: DNA topoisomerase III, partial [Clostridiales bacterium]|nr:DNA topoisomerase III [Clostridiales bacterium]